MKEYYKLDAWCIIEEGFDPEHQQGSESIFSIGNGAFGQRANFEEKYSGPSLQGSYVGGVYYPDKTRVGWWKNGYPEYFAKVLNAPNWIGINLKVEEEEVDLFTAKVEDFVRELNMQKGYLYRSCKVTLNNGKTIKIEGKRFCSMADTELGAIQYQVTPINFSGKLSYEVYVDADVENEDSNYDEKFWDEVSRTVHPMTGSVTAKTKKTGFVVSTGMQFWMEENGSEVSLDVQPLESEKYISNQFSINAEAGNTYSLYKLGTYVSSFNHDEEKLDEITFTNLEKGKAKGFQQMLDEQAAAWEKRWEFGDIEVAGDIAAQQGIRFNIFQLHQTYTGDDERLNIGPKGFTGEKYGGSTYWDTEAYCFQFYMSTAGEAVARQLLVYRWKQLGKAIENAEKLGFTDGAALYPMVTMNGEECHNEWEITFEEIHRNGAIARAVFNYTNYTGKTDYLFDQGLDVLVGISKFWKQRINWSADKQAYVMLGVTGPNEYENNVNNNWYTNYIATWTLRYTSESLAKLKAANLAQYEAKVSQLGITDEELSSWNDIISKMYFPFDESKEIYLQQDGFLDKELTPVADLPANARPLNQKWSWDRILRSPYIKQGDVLQGMYFFENEFEKSEIERTFDFYEPFTVHESSLSPCIHSILASYLGKGELAYQFYLRTARLDLDDYNKEVDEGLHITSMAGTWLSVVEGFGGMRVNDGVLSLNPVLPTKWNSYAFKIQFRNHSMNVNVSKEGISIKNHSDEAIELMLKGQLINIAAEETKMM